jgi:hypothetical protein
MEKFKTDAETAKEILEVGSNRKITLANGWKVEVINLNNQTCKASHKQTSSWFDNEDVEFFINVPATAKTVY